MADLAFMVDTSEVASLTGNALSPVSTGLSGVAREGGFAGVLDERVKAGQTPHPQAGDTPAQTTASAANSATSSSTEGDPAVPVDGKALPEERPNQAAVSTELSAALSLENAADVALVAAINQSALQNMKDGSTASTATGLAVHETGAGPLSGVSQVLLDAPKTPVQAVLRETQFAQPGGGTANILQQPVATNPGGVLPDTKDLDIGKRAANLHASPVPQSGQPMSASIQRALVRAISASGTGEPINTRIAGQPMSSLPSEISLLPNGLTMATQLSKSNMSATTGVDTRMMAQLVSQKGQASSSILSASSVTPSTATVEDASGLLSTLPRLNGTTASSFAPLMQVPTSVGQPGWASEVGQRVTWMAQSELREAQLQLHPRSLGPVEVRIAFGADQQLNVSFSATNPVAREALDAALPRLREMFEQQGLNLGDTDISQHSFADQHKNANEDASEHFGAVADDGENSSDHALVPGRILMGDGLIDAYA